MYFTAVYKLFWVLFTIVATYRIYNNDNVTILSSETVACSDIESKLALPSVPFL